MSANPIHKYPPDPILLVDDDRIFLESLQFQMKSCEIDHILGADDPRRVMGILERREVELVLLDLVMPHISGEELLRKIRERFPEIPVILVTGVEELDTAVRCMRHGAFDYLPKPLDENRLVYAIRRAVEHRKLRKEIDCLQGQAQGGREVNLKNPEAFANIVTRSPAMFRLFETVESISRTGEPVLLTGETGAGKSLLAEAVHQCSRRTGELVHLKIAGLSDAEFSEALFGPPNHGGAGEAGLIQKARGGTLFLDGIADLSMESQAKLLHLIQDAEYPPAAANRGQRNDIRVVAATHEDVRARMDEGLFRRDLYYRLRSHVLYLPPLRDRPHDLKPLVRHFVEKARRSLGRPKLAVSPGVYAMLQNHPFLGNVRELESLVHDVVAREPSRTLRVEAFAAKLENRPKNQKLREYCLREGNPFSQLQNLPNARDCQMMLVAEALRRAKGNKAMAARLVGLTRQTLGKHSRLLKKEAGGETFC
jgi:DNA-binding NtrC family response regulator